MNPAQNQYDTARAFAEDVLRLSSEIPNSAVLSRFRAAAQELEKPELNRLIRHIRALSAQILRGLQNQYDVSLQKIQNKRVSNWDITKVAASVLLFVATFFCHSKLRHAYRFGALALVIAVVGKLFYDLKRVRNSPSKLKTELENHKLAQKLKLSLLNNKVLVMEITTLRADRDAIAADRDAIAADRDVIAADREAIAHEKVGVLANRLVNFATASSMHSDPYQEQYHSINVELP